MKIVFFEIAGRLIGENGNFIDEFPKIYVLNTINVVSFKVVKSNIWNSDDNIEVFRLEVLTKGGKSIISSKYSSDYGSVIGWVQSVLGRNNIEFRRGKL